MKKENYMFFNFYRDIFENYTAQKEYVTQVRQTKNLVNLLCRH